MSYNTKHAPAVLDRSRQNKGNGDKCGRVPGESPKVYNDNGISYRAGMGCSRGTNCFKCTLSDCRFGKGTNPKDNLFMANRGDGLKVCWEGS